MITCSKIIVVSRSFPSASSHDQQYLASRVCCYSCFYAKPCSWLNSLQKPHGTRFQANWLLRKKKRRSSKVFILVDTRGVKSSNSSVCDVRRGCEALTKAFGVLLSLREEKFRRAVIIETSYLLGKSVEST